MVLPPGAAEVRQLCRDGRVPVLGWARIRWIPQHPRAVAALTWLLLSPPLRPSGFSLGTLGQGLSSSSSLYPVPCDHPLSPGDTQSPSDLPQLHRGRGRVGGCTNLCPPPCSPVKQEAPGGRDYPNPSFPRPPAFPARRSYSKGPQGIRAPATKQASQLGTVGPAGRTWVPARPASEGYESREPGCVWREAGLCLLTRLHSTECPALG